MILHIHSPPKKSPKSCLQRETALGITPVCSFLLASKKPLHTLPSPGCDDLLCTSSVNSTHVDIVTSIAEARNIMGRKERYFPTILCTNYLMGLTAEIMTLSPGVSLWLDTELYFTLHGPWEKTHTWLHLSILGVS